MVAIYNSQSILMPYLSGWRLLVEYHIGHIASYLYPFVALKLKTNVIYLKNPTQWVFIILKLRSIFYKNVLFKQQNVF